MELETVERRHKVHHENLLSALGLKTSEAATEEHARLLKSYEYGLQAARQSLNLDAQAVERFGETVIKAIEASSEGWPDIKKPEIRSKLEDQNTCTLEYANRAIDLGLRTWLMLDCCDDQGTLYPQKWSDREPIGEFFSSRFDLCDANDDNEPVSRFPRRFRAADLNALGNITLKWTSFLDEHLRFHEDKREVKIFNNKAWLAAALEQSLASEAVSAHAGRKAIGIPSELLRETLKTLDVLFPHWHEPTVRLLEMKQQDFHLVPPFPRDIPRLREFRFWRYRLIDLVVEYESPPLDWKHIWRDRRNPTAFWTFWIGLAIFFLTLVFGIVSSVLAGFQIKYAKNQSE